MPANSKVTVIYHVAAAQARMIIVDPGSTSPMEHVPQNERGDHDSFDIPVAIYNNFDPDQLAAHIAQQIDASIHPTTPDKP